VNHRLIGHHCVTSFGDRGKSPRLPTETISISTFSQLPVTAAVPKATSPAAPPQPSSVGGSRTAQSIRTLHPHPHAQITTPAKPWSPPRPAAPLTAALTVVLSYAAAPESLSEFSADGDVPEEERHQPPEGWPTRTTLPTADTRAFITSSSSSGVRAAGARYLPLLPGPPPSNATDAAAAAASSSSSVPSATTRGVVGGGAARTSCGDLRCHPGVPCEPAGVVNGGGGGGGRGFRCGRCPPGYIGDGRTCRGTYGFTTPPPPLSFHATLM